MLEDYMTREELASVRDRMIAEALELEREAVDILKELISSVESGVIPRGWADSVVRTPFHAQVQRAADCWASANDLRTSAPDENAQGIENS